MPAPVSFCVSTQTNRRCLRHYPNLIRGKTRPDMRFFATPVAWDYSKGGEERQISSLFGRKRKTYAESQVHSATKRGTRQKVRGIPDRRRSSGYAPGIRRDANYGRWNLGRACRSS